MLDLTKPIQQRCGRKAEYLCSGLIPPRTEAFKIEILPGEYSITVRQPDGRLLTDGEHQQDIVNVPVLHRCKFYINNYVSGPILHETREKAIHCRGRHCLAYQEIEVEFTEGEGL